MNIFNRIVTSVTATVDKAVTQVENHEAVVEAALKDTRSAAAKARVRYSRVSKDGVALRNKLQETIKSEKLWTDRALQVAEQDENKALQCVQRRNQCREQIVHTRQALQAHEKLETNISASIQQIESRIQRLTQQRNMMRSRHSAADAMRIINQIESDSGHYVDDALDRWETVITETEYMTGSLVESDSLHDTFIQEENASALKADLNALLSGAKENKHE